MVVSQSLSPCMPGAPSCCRIAGYAAGAGSRGWATLSSVLHHAMLMMQLGLHGKVPCMLSGGGDSAEPLCLTTVGQRMCL